MGSRHVRDVVIVSLKTEAVVRAILLECAGAFSPRIEDRSVSGFFVCVVDVAGTEGLFGPPLMLAKQIRQRIRSVGVVASVTISANVHTAMCVARGLSGGMPLRMVPRGDEAKALAPLTVTVLDITQVQAETFLSWGIRSVGAVAALPEKSLIARLGQDAKRLLQLAHGKHPHLLQPIDVPFVLKEQAELDSPLDDLESWTERIGEIPVPYLAQFSPCEPMPLTDWRRLPPCESSIIRLINDLD
jgi:protein ImuB